VPREPGHHHGGGKAEHDIEHHRRDHVADAGSAGALVILAQKAVHRVTDDAAQEHDKSVHDTLNQGHGDHIAVGNVGDFMPNDGLDFLARHAHQQTGADRHQRRILEGTGGKGIGFAVKNPDLGHADASLVSQLANGVDDPGFVGILRLIDDAHTGAPFGHRLADQKRNDGAAKAHHQGEAQQRTQIQAVGREVTVDAQQAGHHAQHRHHQHIGQDKEKNTFHDFL